MTVTELATYTSDGEPIRFPEPGTSIEITDCVHCGGDHTEWLEVRRDGTPYVVCYTAGDPHDLPPEIILH